MAILLKVEACEIQFLNARDLDRLRRLRGGVRDSPLDASLRLICNQMFAAGGADNQLVLFRRRCVGSDHLDERATWRDSCFFVNNEAAVTRQYDPHFAWRCNGHSNPCSVGLELEVYRRLRIGILCRSDLLDRVPV